MYKAQYKRECSMNECKLHFMDVTDYFNKPVS